MVKIVSKVKIFCLLFSLVNCLPAEEIKTSTKNTINSNTDLIDEIYNDCVKKDSVSCVKLKAVKFLDKMLDQRDDISINDGVTIVKTAEIHNDGVPRTISSSKSLETMILNKFSEFLRNREIKVTVKGSDVIEAVSGLSRSLDNFTTVAKDSLSEARGKKKKAKILGPLILAVVLKAAALLPLAIGAIALLAGKALLIGKIALVLSAVIGLKKLLAQEKHVTYEVVAHPHHTSSHSSSHSDSIGGSGYSSDLGGFGSGGNNWGRSILTNDIPYKAYTP